MCCRYVSVISNHIINPVITPSGASGTVTGVLAASLVGPDYHLSPVWTPINMQLGEAVAFFPPNLPTLYPFFVACLVSHLLISLGLRLWYRHGQVSTAVS